MRKNVTLMLSMVFNGWNPGDIGSILQKYASNKWEITLDGFSIGEL